MNPSPQASNSPSTPSTLYQLDFFEWANTNARYMREQRFDMVDFVKVDASMRSLTQ